jgi:RHS repeat-associated protein
MLIQKAKQILLLILLFLTATVHAAQTVTYFHNDIVGTPLIATDASGNVVWKENYYPYGERLNPEKKRDNKLWFTGKPYDMDTGLTYLGARYYNPLLGRFMGVDPQGFDPKNIHSFNRYAYANNNPLKFTDPDGRNAVTAFGGLIFETYSWAKGDGFNGASIWGALKDGYNGGGDGFFHAATQDILTFGTGVIGAVAKLANVARITSRISNPVPSTLARVVPDTAITRASSTLGKSNVDDVFVTAANDIRGLNAKQIAERLKIPESPTGFRVTEFPTPKSGIASPINRTDPGFVGGGRTAGGAREFVIPNGPIPVGSSTRTVQ